MVVVMEIRMIHRQENPLKLCYWDLYPHWDSGFADSLLCVRLGNLYIHDVLVLLVVWKACAETGR